MAQLEVEGNSNLLSDSCTCINHVTSPRKSPNMLISGLKL